MNFLSLIEAKRDAREFCPDDIRALVKEYVGNRIPDYQMAALLMAVYFRGLTAAETVTLTAAMRESGETLEWPDDPRPVVDKHSTGGVGDKVSLPLAPLLACLGFRVPMISGRGLGITGGTLDKLDAIPGFRTGLTIPDLQRIVSEVGCAICGQTDQIVPADKRLYALRDATGTVASIPLIVSSILSKKLAEGLKALVLDVKVGRAAFMTTMEHALELAHAMVRLGADSGVSTRALITDMNAPLGRAAGNWLEVKEAVGCLEGRGPVDLQGLVVQCAAHLLLQTGRATHLPEAIAAAEDCLKSGEPRRRWDQMLVAQGADLEVFHRKLSRTSTAQVVVEVKARSTGFVSACDALKIGELVRDLGAGRSTKDARVDYDAGVDELVKVGEPVRAEQVLGRVHASSAAMAEGGARRLESAFTIGEQPPAPGQLVKATIE